MMHTRLAGLSQWLMSATLLLTLSPVKAQDSTAFAIGFSYHSSAFPLVGKGKAAPVYVEPGTAKVVSIAAAALQQDIKAVSGVSPALQNQLPAAGGYAVLIGTLGNGGWIDDLSQKGKLHSDGIRGKWESFMISVVNQPFGNIPQALVIAGSDARGTAFGIFELSRIMGVSPWIWWADVAPATHTELYVAPASYVQGPPSVKYRGIFLNDEDWGLHPWAAGKMDTDVKDIGPKTYTRIFELLLRLKANYIWPAMHPCTKAFYYYPDNPRLANDYGIVVGSSHCEPMLRNNVFEWAENYVHEYGTAPGEWRYDHNKTQILDYWKDRIQQSEHYESVYTVGMRGIHDGSMPGPAPIKEKVKLLQQVIDDQRGLLGHTIGKPLQDIPQIFCPYKEVLTVYRNGLSLPDDVTIVWSDDNYGYIRQLSDEQERQRSGRSGVYYHLSYWGSPQDYLWLSSISPSLVSYEMSKAWKLGADRVWIFNAGDIKPAEMDIEFAMDLAWNVQRWSPDKVNQWLRNWANRTFGPTYADTIASIEKTYYLLAQSGKPEQMNAPDFGEEEATERVEQYQAIAVKAEGLYAQMPARLKDAFFELVLYPVEGAYRMNEKILYAKISLLLAASGKQEALAYAQKATDAFIAIQQLTARYNDSIAGGKWHGMMSWHPRDQAVFNMPLIATQGMIDSARSSGVLPAVRLRAKTVVIPASSYVQKNEPAGVSFHTIEVLGAGGNGVTLLPFIPSESTDSSVTGKPWVEYKVPLNKGSHSLWVRCLPLQSANGSGLLRYAVSFNGETPRLINIHTEAESKVWKVNVLRGFAQGTSPHTIASSGVATLRVYFIDPGMVINQLEVQ